MSDKAWLQALVNVVPQAAACHLSDGSLGALNAAAAELLGCHREDAIGRNWTEGLWTTVDRDEREVSELELPGRLTLATGRSISNMLLGIRANPDERTVWVNASSVLLPGGSNEPKGAAIVVLEPMVLVSQLHPAAGELDRVSQVPPNQRQFRQRSKAEGRHRALFEDSKCVMLIIHPITGRILDANHAACKFYGYAHEALVRMDIYQINTLGREEVSAEMSRAHVRKSGRFRFRHRLASGELREVEVYSSPIPIEGENVLHSIVHDVTKRETARAQVREANRELRLINAIITAAVQGASPVELLQEVCQELGDLLNAKEVVAVFLKPRPDGAAIAAAFVDDLPSDREGQRLTASTLGAFRRRLAAGASWMLNVSHDESRIVIEECLVTSPKSAWVLPLVSGEETFGAIILASEPAIRFPDDKQLALGRQLAAQVSKALAIVDIEQTRRRLLAAIEQTTDIVIITEVDGTVVYCNRAFEAVTGGKVLWGVDQRVPDVIGAPSLHEVWAKVAAGREWSGSFHANRSDGARFDADAVVSPVRNEAGDVSSIIAVARDVTHERLLRQQMQQAQKMEGIGRLAGGLAHDFNNTLAAIMGYAGLVRARLSPDHPAHADVLEIQETILRASNLSRQLLTFARRQVTEAEPLDLNDVILNLDRMLRRLIGEDIELVAVPAASVHRTVAEHGQIEQVLVNLVVNARDAMPSGGKIVIETENVERDADALAGYAGTAPGEFVHMSIKDNGIGMSEEVKQHLFEPFFTTKSADKGTGLGLATCFGIVGQCGGYIEVESEVGEGTTIHVYLPATSQYESIAPSERVPMVLPSGDETVLVAEDDPVVRRMAVRLLENNGYLVLESSNGEDALRVSARHKGEIHVLLTDVVMPRMGARELIEAIKKQRPGIRVLLMSGYADDTQLRQSAGEQQIPFLSKPFTEMMLTYKLRGLLDR